MPRSPAAQRPATTGALATAALLILLYALPFRDVPLVLSSPVALRLFDVAAVAVLGVGFFLLAGSRRLALSAAAALAFALFLAHLCFSSIRGLDAGGQVALMVRPLIWMPYCAAVYVAGSVLAARHERSVVLRHLVWSIITACVLSGALFLLAPEVVERWAGGIDLSRQGIAVWRFPGFASEPNFWGSLLLFLLPLAWAGVLSPAVRARLGGLGPLPFAGLLIGAFATFSTFAHVMLVVSLFAALIVMGRLRRPGLILGAVAIGVVVALPPLVASGYLEHLLSKVSDPTYGSTSARIHAGAAALGMWATSPLFGMGLGTYPRYYQLFATVGLPPIEGAHSVVLATLAEQGLLGLAMLMVLLLALLGVLEAPVRRAMRKDLVMRLLFLGLLPYAIYFVTNATLYLYYFWFYCGLFAGMARVVGRVGEGRTGVAVGDGPGIEPSAVRAGLA